MRDAGAETLVRRLRDDDPQNVDAVARAAGEHPAPIRRRRIHALRNGARGRRPGALRVAQRGRSTDHPHFEERRLLRQLALRDRQGRRPLLFPHPDVPGERPAGSASPTLSPWPGCGRPPKAAAAPRSWCSATGCPRSSSTQTPALDPGLPRSAAGAAARLGGQPIPARWPPAGRAPRAHRHPRAGAPGGARARRRISIRSGWCGSPAATCRRRSGWCGKAAPTSRRSPRLPVKD